MKRLIAALLLAPLAISAAPKKWYPGHYLEVDQLEDIDVRELTAAKDVMKGAWVRYNWANIEQSAGKFDFSVIDKDVATLTSKGFKIGLILEDKAFNKPLGVRCVPADMVGNSNYSGGQVVVPNGNVYKCVSKRWVTKVSERWVAYLKKVGERYDSNPNVVMIQNTESATSYTGTVSSVDYLAHLKREANGFATAFPTTPWAMSLNWNVLVADRDPLVKLISSLGGGITHPDSIPPNGQGNQFDSFFVSYRGKIVSAPLAEMTYIDGKETVIGTSACPTFRDFVNFVINKQGAHFAAWQRFAWGKVPYNFGTNLAPSLRAIPTIKTCPSNITCQ